MKITEVIEPTEQALFEALDAENDTGFATGDLVKIVKSKNGPWSKPMTGDEMIARLEAALGQHG
jgi:hypothetical protein